MSLQTYALFFRPDWEPIKANYGHLTEELLLKSGVLQATNQKIVMTAGDLLFNEFRFGMSLYGIVQHVLSGSGTEGKLVHPSCRVDPAYEAALYSTLFTVVLTGTIGRKTINKLVKPWLETVAYVGWKRPVFELPIHRFYYREMMFERYLIHGTRVRTGRDLPLYDWRVETLEEWGFQDIEQSDKPSLFHHLVDE